MSLIRADKLSKRITYFSESAACTEGLRKGRWVGIHWSSDRRMPNPSEEWEEDALGLVVCGEKAEGGWDWEGVSGSSRSASVYLSRPASGLRLEINTSLDGTAILTRRVGVTNAGDAAIAIDEIFPWVVRAWANRRFEEDMDGEKAFCLGSFTRDDWAHEGWFEWSRLSPGRTRVECDKGQGFNGPFFILRNEGAGELWICHLAWSANWVMAFDLELGSRESMDSVVFGIGPSSRNHLRVIEPGETVTSPAVHLGLVNGGLDAAVQAMHSHIRRSTLPARRGDRSHLIQYAVPGDQGYPAGSPRGLDEEVLLENVELAGELGAEVFIVDAGWWDVVGDWVPSQARFPRGLAPVIERVHGKRMLFGLYAEIEGGRGEWEKSQVYREHPEWFGPKNVLRLALPEVAEYVEGQLVGLIEGYDLDLFRLDYNPLFTFEGSVTERFGFQESDYWRYYEALDSILERIRGKYPELVLQQAAAGGARSDLGTASRFHENYLTDGLRVPHVLKVYSGQTLALPPETFVVGLGADGGVGKGHPMNLRTNLRTIFALSTPWIYAGIVAANLDGIDPVVLDSYRRYGRIYEEFIRPILPNCRTYHHSPASSKGGVSSSPWFAMEYASEDRSKAWAMVARIAPSESEEYTLRPRGLEFGRRYLVTLDEAGQSFEMGGATLLREGLALRLEGVGSSELLLFDGG